MKNRNKKNKINKNDFNEEDSINYLDNNQIIDNNKEKNETKAINESDKNAPKINKNTIISNFTNLYDFNKIFIENSNYRTNII